jgi:DNA-directed RNA polymerase subunit omega
MLLYPPINEIREKADSRYTLVVLAAKRARDLIAGKPSLTTSDSGVPISIAAEEIMEDLITYSRPEAEPDAEAQETALGA